MQDHQQRLIHSIMQGDLLMQCISCVAFRTYGTQSSNRHAQQYLLLFHKLNYLHSVHAACYEGLMAISGIDLPCDCFAALVRNCSIGSIELLVCMGVSGVAESIYGYCNE